MARKNVSSDFAEGPQGRWSCVFFEDECVFQQSGTRTATWARVGVGTTVKSEPCRRSVKAFGAVSVETKPRFHFQISEKFNAQSYLRFLKRVVRFNSDKTVYLIADNARYHHAKLVREWVASNADKIVLFFLPAYSPEFNAVEHIWRMTKRKSTHNRHFKTITELHTRVFRRFNRYQGNPGSLRPAITRFLTPSKNRACKT